MTNKNSSIEANLAAARTAANQMFAEWTRWNGTTDANVKHECLAKYAAAFTLCKVFIENYLKRLYPNETTLPPKLVQDIRQLVTDMESITRVTQAQLQKIQRDIDQLSRDAA
jgi:hypothetical protein